VAVDWAFVIYDGSHSRFDAWSAWASWAVPDAAHTFELTVRNGTRSPLATGRHENSTFVKMWHQLQCVQLLQSHHAVLWLLDGDLSLVRFDMGTFMHVWRCSFEEGTPYVWQPVVRPGTPQRYHYVNAMVWHGNSGTHASMNTSGALSFRAPLVEIQAPAMDASFAKWIFHHLLKHGFMRMQQEYQSEWGLDYIICKAAREYGLAHANGANRRPACAVIVAAALTHDNDHAYRKDRAYVNGGYALLRWTHKNFSRWYFEPKDYDLDRGKCVHKLSWCLDLHNMEGRMFNTSAPAMPAIVTRLRHGCVRR